MDQVELVQATVFSLEQAARRIEALADQARAPELAEQLRAVARLLGERAGLLTQLHRPPDES